MNHNSSLLQMKLRANGQRLARQSFLRRLPAHLSDYLATRAFVSSPQFDELAPPFYISPTGIGEPVYQPAGYLFREFSWEQQLLEAAQSVGARHDAADALFYPWEDNPLYRVRFGWVRENLSELFGFCPDEMGVIRADLQAGIVLSNYCGTLEHDPNPDEIVFELAIWGY